MQKVLNKITTQRFTQKKILSQCPFPITYMKEF